MSWHGRNFYYHPIICFHSSHSDGMTDLAGHRIVWNKDYISQPSVQLSVAILLSYDQYDVNRRGIWNLKKSSERKANFLLLFFLLPAVWNTVLVSRALAAILDQKESWNWKPLKAEQYVEEAWIPEIVECCVCPGLTTFRLWERYILILFKLLKVPFVFYIFLQPKQSYLLQLVEIEIEQEGVWWCGKVI